MAITWTRLLRRERSPRPPYTIRGTFDYPAAVRRVDDLVHAQIHHPNPLVREQATFDQYREGVALVEFLTAELPRTKPRHRAAVETALREWRWSSERETDLDNAEKALLRHFPEVPAYPVGRLVKHRAGSVWEVVSNALPGNGGWGEYLPALPGDCQLRCVDPAGSEGLEVGMLLRAHRHYLASLRWEPARQEATP